MPQPCTALSSVSQEAPQSTHRMESGGVGRKELVNHQTKNEHWASFVRSSSWRSYPSSSRPAPRLLRVEGGGKDSAAMHDALGAEQTRERERGEGTGAEGCVYVSSVCEQQLKEMSSLKKIFSCGSRFLNLQRCAERERIHKHVNEAPGSQMSTQSLHILHI